MHFQKKQKLLTAIVTSIVLLTPVFSSAGNTDQKIVTVHPSNVEGNKQGLSQFFGISAKSGAHGISMNKIVIPPGGSAKAHTHSGFESAIYLIQGRVKTLYGKDLKQSVVNEAGDFIFIPPNVLHQPVNLSKTEPAIAIVARNDPNEQENVVLHNVPSVQLQQ